MNTYYKILNEIASVFDIDQWDEQVNTFTDTISKDLNNIQLSCINSPTWHALNKNTYLFLCQEFNNFLKGKISTYQADTYALHIIPINYNTIFKKAVEYILKNNIYFPAWIISKDWREYLAKLEDNYGMINFQLNFSEKDFPMIPVDENTAQNHKWPFEEINKHCLNYIQNEICENIYNHIIVKSVMYDLLDARYQEPSVKWAGSPRNSIVETNTWGYYFGINKNGNPISFFTRFVWELCSIPVPPPDNIFCKCRTAQIFPLLKVDENAPF